MEYRGIELADSVKLYNKNGSLNKKISKAIDSIAVLLENNGHILLSKYTSDGEKILIDFKCGHEPHYIEPNSYKNGNRCPKCGKISSAEKLANQPKKDFYLLVESNGHILLSEYKNSKTKVLIDFKCGHSTHWIKPNDYSNGCGCPKCGSTRMKEKRFKHYKDDFLILVKQNSHILLTEYNVNYEKVLIDFCCGHKPHWIKPIHYQNGRRCPICKESKGERKIRNWLEENDYKFYTQKMFDGLVGIKGGNLSYDFHLPKQNLLIEYQGIFHDGKSNDYVKQNLECQQEHDRRKKQYADQNNIELLEIWYWDFDNIDFILNNLMNNN